MLQIGRGPDLGDRMEMAHSVEGLVPFMDHHVAEYLQNVPVSLKIRDVTEKYILGDLSATGSSAPDPHVADDDRRSHANFRPPHYFSGDDRDIALGARSTPPLPFAMQLRPFRLERYYDTREFTAPYMLSASDCESWTVAELAALDPRATDRLLALPLGYTHSTGHPELRERIAATYDRVQPDDIIVHAGAQEAVFIFMAAALAPGDHVIVHHPAYQSLAEIPRALGCSVTPWTTSATHGWALDVDVLRRAINPRTRAIVINCPHSPTGSLPSATTLDAIVAVAREHGLLIFSDEVYRGLEYDARDRLRAVADLYERGVSLGVMSKAYGLAGLRIGWLAVRDRALARRVREVKDYTTICSSAPSECLATIALEHGRAIVQRNVGIIRDNLARFRAFLEVRPGRFAWVPPRAGPVAFVSPVGVTDIERYCDAALARAGVLLLPGTVFDESSTAMRVGFGRRSFPEALERYAQFVDAE